MAQGKKTIFWDFDGTLVPFTSWRLALMDVLDECEPGHYIDQEQIRPFLRDGFPWHKPQEPHTHLTPEAWWEHLEPVFVRAFTGVGFKDGKAKALAKQVRKHMINPKRYTLLDDTVPTLKYLTEKGWNQGILSNHVPELPHIVKALGLSPFIGFCLASGVTGFEKPNPQAFMIALSRAGNPERAWMVGDNLIGYKRRGRYRHSRDSRPPSSD